MSSKKSLILLPGNSLENRDWIESVEDMLRTEFTRTHIQYYDHWENVKNFSLKTERQKLVTTAKQASHYTIFAKSVGVFLGLDTVNKQLIKPKLCIFTGTTSRSAELLTDWHIPTLFIQEEYDPFFSFQELAEVVHQLDDDRHQLLVIPGTKHWYDKIHTVKQDIVHFIST